MEPAHLTCARSPRAAAIGVLLSCWLWVGGVTPARAQSPDAADLCTPDVMRLCEEFIPDADRIVGCLKVKRRQLSAQCLRALTAKPGKGKKKRRRSQHRRAG
jgi:hypothetical protein